jgi:hypothetical protein
MEHAATPVWIDPSWLSWEAWGARTSFIPNGADRREYEIHQHACDRLASNPNEFDRVDAITTLRRVVGRRVKGLKEIYQLRDLPTGTRSMKDLELLECFGIIRPLMLKQLIDIRDIVEHQDSNPPPTDECLMFADLVWYFLRSTDNLVNSYVEDIYFEPRRMTYRDYPQTVIQFGEFFTEPGILARLKASSFAYEPRADWLKIKATQIDEFDAYHVTNASETGEYQEVKIPAIDVRGKVDGTNEQMRHLYELYFKIGHFV